MTVCGAIGLVGLGRIHDLKFEQWFAIWKADRDWPKVALFAAPTLSPHGRPRLRQGESRQEAQEGDQSGEGGGAGGRRRGRGIEITEKFNMICPNCNCELVDGTAVCPYCGTPMAAACAVRRPPPRPCPPSSPRRPRRLRPHRLTAPRTSPCPRAPQPAAREAHEQVPPAHRATAPQAAYGRGEGAAIACRRPARPLR